MNEKTILHTVPAASELHKVPGFDPMKYLRRAVNARGEPVMELEPRYQRLWFRLACPKGRMVLNPLRITDQLAIFEAKVFFHRDDTPPASSFISTKTAQETSNYIRAAQDEALKIALDNAGFGIQLCDVTQASSDAGSGAAAPTITVSSNEAVAEQSAPAQSAPPPVQGASAAPTLENIQTAQSAAVDPPPAAQSQAAEAPAAGTSPKSQSAVETEQHDTSNCQQSALTAVLKFPGQTEESVVPQGESQTGDTPAQAGTPAQTTPAYTEDMSVEEICQIMTLEEARSVVVPKGPCGGWTMAQVAERRFSSLRFYLTQFCDYSNIHKAAASLLIQEAEQKKAG